MRKSFCRESSPSVNVVLDNDLEAKKEGLKQLDANDEAL
jgi:hypothetical protein